MTTSAYRMTVIGQLVAIGALGVVSVVIVLAALPEFHSRRNLSAAIQHYEEGASGAADATAPLKRAQESLEEARAHVPDMVPVLSLYGLVALRLEQPAIASDAYKKLESALAAQNSSTAPAVNGIGCARLLEARLSNENVIAATKAAFEEFKAAAAQDPEKGDAHVNAAICAIEQRELETAAWHLSKARATRSLSLESLVGYHAALGSVLSTAAAKGPKTAAAVARQFRDPDRRLKETGRMLVRATEEYDKAMALLSDRKSLDELGANVAIARTRLLAHGRVGEESRGRYCHLIVEAIGKHKKHFPLEQRQTALLVLGMSWHRAGETEFGLGQLRRAAKLGPLSPRLQYHSGAIMLDIARAAKAAKRRAQLETDGVGLLLRALRSPKLSKRMRFRALSGIGVIHWRQKNTTGAMKHMNEARALLAKIEKTRESPSKREQARFYHNLGLVLYAQGDTAGGAEMMKKALALNPKLKDLTGDFALAAPRAVVEDIRAVLAAQHSPSMPVVTAVVYALGPAAPKKEEIQMLIDGASAPFTIGPKSRIFALPRKPLSEGKHTVTVAVTMAGADPVRETAEIVVDYGPFKPRVKKDGS